MSKHTPGLWTVVEIKNPYQIKVVDEIGFFVASLTDMFEGEGESDKKHASLIASAPELLKACKLALKCLEADYTNNGSRKDWEESTVLRKIIAKAEGK